MDRSHLIFSSFTIFTVSTPVSSAESGLSIAGWSLWGGAADRMQFFVVFFISGGGGRNLCRWLVQRIGWQDGADICVWRPGIDFECSWDGLSWVLLVSQGLRCAFFVQCLRYLAPLGYREIQHGQFWLHTGTCWSFPYALVSVSLGCLVCLGRCW